MVCWQLIKLATCNPGFKNEICFTPNIIFFGFLIFQVFQQQYPGKAINTDRKRKLNRLDHKLIPKSIR